MQPGAGTVRCWTTPSERCGPQTGLESPTSPYLRPGGGLRWRVWGGDRLIPLLPSADTGEEGRSPEVQQAHQAGRSPGLGRRQRAPTQHRECGSGPCPLSSLWGSLLPWKFGLYFVLAGKGCLRGMGCRGGGIWALGHWKCP